MNNAPRHNPEYTPETQKPNINLKTERLMGGFFSVLNIDIDGNTDTEKKEQLEVGVYMYFSRLEANKSSHSDEFDTRLTKTIEYIFSQKNIKLSEIEHATIDANGALRVISKNKQTHTIFLHDIWDNALLSPEKKKVIKETKEKEQKLQNDVAKEAFYGGNMVIEYLPGVAVAGAGIQTAIGFGKIAVQAVTVKTPEWPRKISLEKPVILAKEWLAGSVNHLAEKVGYTYNFETKTFVNPAKEAFGASARTIRNMSFAEYQKQPYYNSEIATEAKFNEIKARTLKITEPVVADVSTGKITPKAGLSKLGGLLAENAGHLFFFPVFMHEFNRHQSTANAIKWLSEMALFTAGFHIGNVVGKKLPLPAKVLFPLVTGGGAVMWWQYAADKFLDANRKKWEYLQKSNYSDGKSIVGHAVGWLFINEALDLGNSLWRSVTGKKTSWTDLGIPKIDFNIPGTGKHFSTPEITWFQNKITMGTAPSEWIQSAANRDTDSWNTSVDRYKITITKDIYELIGSYVNNKNAFRDSGKIQKAWGKEKLFEAELGELLMWGQSSTIFNAQIQNMISGISAELPHLSSKTIPNSVINEIIAINVGSMKINDIYIENRKELLQWEMNMLPEMVNMLPVDKKTKDYILTFPKRMLDNEQLFTTPVEEKMYMSVIQNTSMMNVGGQQLKVGNYFAMILDRMMEQKNEKYFLNQLSSGDKNGFEWTIL